MLRLLTIALLGVSLAGCAKTMYSWNGYDDCLYRHYRNPTERESFGEKLKEIVEEAEAEGKVPPGIYAEYGFFLYEGGDFPQAAAFFAKEQEKWPESAFFMQKMISNAKAGGKKPAPSEGGAK